MSFWNPSYSEAAVDEFAAVSRHLGVRTETDDSGEIRLVLTSLALVCVLGWEFWNHTVRIKFLNVCYVIHVEIISSGTIRVISYWLDIYTICVRSNSQTAFK